MRFALSVAVVLALSGCVAPGPAAGPDPLPASPPAPGSPEQAARVFLQVIARVEPVAEQLCRDRRALANCDFRIIVDDRPGMPANAFQTLDRQGRPVIGFTVALILGAANADELAFVLGHETAHHIAGHLPRRQEETASAAQRAGEQALADGLDAKGIRAAADAEARSTFQAYSRTLELEADALGAEIAWLAGFDALRGAAYLDRLPGPGGTGPGNHPDSARRKAMVAATLHRLQD